MKKLILSAAILTLGFVIWALPSSQTAGVLVSWPENYDTAYPNESYYWGRTVYWGTASRVYSFTNYVAPGYQSNIVSGLVRGAQYYFAVTVTGTNGLEADYSTEVTYTVPNKPPKQGTPSTL